MVRVERVVRMERVEQVERPLRFYSRDARALHPKVIKDRARAAPTRYCSSARLSRSIAV